MSCAVVCLVSLDTLWIVTATPAAAAAVLCWLVSAPGPAPLAEDGREIEIHAAGLFGNGGDSARAAVTWLGGDRRNGR